MPPGTHSVIRWINSEQLLGDHPVGIELGHGAEGAGKACTADGRNSTHLAIGACT